MYPYFNIGHRGLVLCSAKAKCNKFSIRQLKQTAMNNAPNEIMGKKHSLIPSIKVSDHDGNEDLL